MTTEPHPEVQEFTVPKPELVTKDYLRAELLALEMRLLYKLGGLITVGFTLLAILISMKR